MNDRAQEEGVATESHPYNDPTNAMMFNVWLAKTTINERGT